MLPIRSEYTKNIYQYCCPFELPRRLLREVSPVECRRGMFMHAVPIKQKDFTTFRCFPYNHRYTPPPKYYLPRRAYKIWKQKRLKRVSASILDRMSLFCSPHTLLYSASMRHLCTVVIIPTSPPSVPFIYIYILAVP